MIFYETDVIMPLKKFFNNRFLDQFWNTSQYTRFLMRPRVFTSSLFFFCRYKKREGGEIEISYGDIKPIDPIYCHHFHFPQYAIISLHPQKYLLTSDDKT